MNTRAQTKTAKREAISQVSEAKSRLLDVVRKLDETPSCKTACQQLEVIIARLEDWQMRNKEST